MSLLIRGMEMPKEFDSDVYIELACGIDGNLYARLYNCNRGGLTEWCEIVHVPQHGRLIDADDLANSITGVIYHSDLRDAPTIIPAELLNEEVNE
jgi:hypothetical protein